MGMRRTCRVVAKIAGVSPGPSVVLLYINGLPTPVRNVSPLVHSHIRGSEPGSCASRLLSVPAHACIVSWWSNASYFVVDIEFHILSAGADYLARG